MGQIETKSSLDAPQLEVRDEISELTEHLSLGQRSAVLRTSKVLAGLSASERRAALDIIRQRAQNGGLDYPWFAGFLAVLGRLKAEESRSEAKQHFQKNTP